MDRLWNGVEHWATYSNLLFMSNKQNLCRPNLRLSWRCLIRYWYVDENYITYPNAFSTSFIFNFISYRNGNSISPFLNFSTHHVQFCPCVPQAVKLVFELLSLFFSIILDNKHSIPSPPNSSLTVLTQLVIDSLIRWPVSFFIPSCWPCWLCHLNEWGIVYEMSGINSAIHVIYTKAQIFEKYFNKICYVLCTEAEKIGENLMGIWTHLL